MPKTIISGRIHPLSNYASCIYGEVTIGHELGGRPFVVDDAAAAGAPGGLLDDEPRQLAHERGPDGHLHIPTRPLKLTAKALAEMQSAAARGLLVIELD